MSEQKTGSVRSMRDGPIAVPTSAKTARAECRLVAMGPPRGVRDEDCGTAEMLIGPAPIPGFPQGRANYVYYQPSAAEVEQLAAGGFIEFAQYGSVVQPFSAAVWPAEPPNEGRASDDVTVQGDVGRDSAARDPHDGADGQDVGHVTSEADPADEKSRRGEPSAAPAPPRCDARIRPFPNDTELTCEIDVGVVHAEHLATLRDYAWPGSKTEITWQEDDRRTFRGDWRPCRPLQIGGCVLPAGHRGAHAP